MKEENEYQEQGGQYEGAQDPDNDGQKLFLPKCMNKKVPIGIEFHQSQIPQLVTLEELKKKPGSILTSLRSPRAYQTFIASNISPGQRSEYLTFIQEFYLQKDPDIFIQGAISKQKITTKALELLHRCKYNVIRAKFNVTFPYYTTFNRLRPEAAIELTDNQMQVKMRKHKQGLRRTREKDEQKWAEDIVERIQNKVDLHILVALIESGKQNKYDLPDNVKDLLDRASKFGKELKKMTSQTNKVNIEKLLQKRQQLNAQKIITNEMNVFESTVTRCIEWTKKVHDFNQTFFVLINTSDGPIKQLKRIPQKIQYRNLSNLVDQYTSLPLIDDDFDNIKILYDDTIELLDKLPQFAKSVKTRNQNISKITISAIRQLQSDIRQHSVKCDEFEFFMYQVEQNLEFIEKISMMLEDQKTQKTTKQMTLLLKQAHDIPIISNIVKRLENQIEYIVLMDKIRKDIQVYNKFQQTEENIRLAYEKGFVSAELIEYQSKLDVFKNWYNTTQKFNFKVEYTKVDIVKKENEIISNMIDDVSFQNQLMKAKDELKIDETEVKMYYSKLELIAEHKRIIAQLLDSKTPDLSQLTDMTLICIEEGLKYPQFLSLFVLTRRLLLDIADLSYLLNQHGFLQQQDVPSLFFTLDQHQQIVGFTTGHKKQLKQLTKTQMQMMLQETTIKAFPSDCVEWTMFKKFVESCTEQEEKAAKLIANYNRLESFEGHSERLFNQIEQLLKELKGMLVSDSLMRQLSQVLQILKCRRVIDTKIVLEMKQVFTPDDIQYIQKIKNKLNHIKEVFPLQKLKPLSLRFQSQNKVQLFIILNKITNVTFEKPLKLSEINRIHKEIDRIQLDSIQLRTMKRELSARFDNCEQWRARMLEIKNKKKPKKDQGNEKKEQQIVEIEVEEQQNIVKSSQNDYFFYYFKFPLLLIKFYQGLKLKTNLEQLSRLKNFITQIYGFLTKFQAFEKNDKPLALQISDLNSEGNKWGSVFLLEKWKISRRNEFVMHWRNMAVNVLESMPILRLQQRTILMIPDIPLNHKESIAHDELIEEENHHEVEIAGKEVNQPLNQPPSGKRKRKINTFYSNDDITLLVQDLLPSKFKKKKKQQAAPSKRKFQSSKKSKKSVYCICRLGLMNQSSIMLQCQVCERWFHTECVGIRKSYIKAITNYFCPGCCKRYDISPDYYRAFFWESNRKMSEQNFRYLVNEGHDMKVTLEELSPLLALEGRIDLWKDQVEKTVKLVIETDNKGKASEIQNQKILFDLYLESIWLPTVHVETDVLITLLKKHDTSQRVNEIRRQAAALTKRDLL